MMKETADEGGERDGSTSLSGSALSASGDGNSLTGVKNRLHAPLCKLSGAAAAASVSAVAFAGQQWSSCSRVLLSSHHHHGGWVWGCGLSVCGGNSLSLIFFQEPTNKKKKALSHKKQRPKQPSQMTTRTAEGEPRVELVSVCGRTYRRHATRQQSVPTAQLRRAAAAGAPFDDDDDGPQQCSSSRSSAATSQTATAEASVRVAEAALPFIVGKGGATQRSIEEATGCKLSVPPKKKKAAASAATETAVVVVTVRGPDEAAVSRAVERIEVLGATAEEKAPFTHFLCAPLAPLSPPLVERVRALLDSCRSDVPAGAAADPRQLHLTLLMLRLPDDASVQRAAEVLRTRLPPHPQPADQRTVSLRGLEYMNDDPSAVDVLYARVDAVAPALVAWFQSVVDVFVEAGLAVPQDRELRLHATVVNTRHADVGDAAPFDARPLLARFGSAELGTVRLDELHLSQRFAYDPEDGFFHRAAVYRLQKQL